MVTANNREEHVWVACDLCGCDDASHYLTGRDWGVGSFQVVRCMNCGLLYTNPRPSSEWLNKYYPSDYYAHMPPVNDTLKQTLLRYGAHRWLHYPQSPKSCQASPFPRWLVAVLARLARRQMWRVPHRVAGSRLLDIGCGWGEYLVLMRQLGWDVIGVERSSQAVKLAREQLGLDVRQGELQWQRFPEEAFDVVTFWDVLEHLEGPSATLSEVHRILRPHGWLLAKVPNCHSLQAGWFGNSWCQWDLPRHLCHFRPMTLRALLEAQGFSVVLLECMSSPATTASSLAYYLDARFGISHWQQPRSLRGLLRAVAAGLTWLSDTAGCGDSLVIHARKSSP